MAAAALNAASVLRAFNFVESSENKQLSADLFSAVLSCVDDKDGTRGDATHLFDLTEDLVKRDNATVVTVFGMALRDTEASDPVNSMRDLLLSQGYPMDSAPYSARETMKLFKTLIKELKVGAVFSARVSLRNQLAGGQG